MRYLPLMLLAIVLGISGATYLNNWGAAAEQEPQPTVAKSITITKAELDAMVSQRMAQAMLEESRSLHAEVLQEKHWHTAIFNGVAYTIYTGPGDIASATIPHSILEEPKDEDSTGIRKQQ